MNASVSISVKPKAVKMRVDGDGLICGQAPRQGYVDPAVLKPEHRLILRLRAAGKPWEEIVEASGLSEVTVKNVCRSAAGKAYIERVYEELDEEFKGQYKLVVDAIRTCLQVVDPGVKLAAAALWGRMNGKYTQKVQVAVTAEDVVQKLLSGESVDVARDSSAAGSGTTLQDSEQEG